MRPVNKGTSPPTYQLPKTLTFKSQVIRRVFGNYSPTLDECLESWLEVVKDAATMSHTAEWKDKKAAKKLIEQQVTKLYKQAAVPLTQQLGDFCSYCESPVTGLLEVEHIVPKAEYPFFAVDWDNFLIACNPCNQPKGKNPSRGKVSGWLGTSSPNEQDYYDEIRQHYVWPDLDSQSYRKLPADLWYKDPNLGWQPVPLKDAANPNHKIISVDIATRTVMAELFLSQGNFRIFPVEVRLSDHSPNGEGKEMIGLCRLNTTGNQASTYDRRVLNRTKAWFTVLESLSTIYTAVQPGSPPHQQQNQFDHLWPLVCLTARNTGFYSVWVRVLSQHKDPLSNPLDQRFVQDTNLPLYFPNTDTTSLP